MKTTDIFWTENALEDLEHIRLWLAEQAGEEIMLKEARRIWQSCQRLKTFPESGRPGRLPMTREIVAPPYVIPYRIQGDRVEILTVFHSARKR